MSKMSLFEELSAQSDSFVPQVSEEIKKVLREQAAKGSKEAYFGILSEDDIDALRAERLTVIKEKDDGPGRPGCYVVSWRKPRYSRTERTRGG